MILRACLCTNRKPSIYIINGLDFYFYSNHTFFAFFRVTDLFSSIWQILLIIKGCPDTLIVRFTAKPYILWKILFHWICSKFNEFKHGHIFFWPQRSWRLLEAKNTPRRPILSWRSWFFEKSIKWKFLSNLINPLADPIRFDLRPQVKKIQPPRSLDVHSY